MRAAEDRQADDVDVLLHRGRGDHLRRLVQAGVDDLHAGVAQRGGDDLGAAVVAVEAGLGDQNANRTHECRRDRTASAIAAQSSVATTALGSGAKASRPRSHGAATDVFRATSSISPERRAQRPVAPAVVRLLDDEAASSAQLGQVRRRVEPDPVLALAASPTAPPTSVSIVEHAGERIERPLVADHRAVVRLATSRARGTAPSRRRGCRHARRACRRA